MTSLLRVIVVQGLALERRHEAGGKAFIPYPEASGWVPLNLVQSQEDADRFAIVEAAEPFRIDREQQQAQPLVDDIVNRLAVAAKAALILCGWTYIAQPVTGGTPEGVHLIVARQADPLLGQGKVLQPVDVDHALSYRANEVHATRFAVNRARKAIADIQDAVQQVADITVALEALLMRDAGKTELRQQFSLRGSHLLGGDALERRRSYDFLKSLYDLRSDILHNASTKVPEGELRKRHDEGVAIFHRAAERILTGGYPSPERWIEMLLGRD
jgi:hypothetical protein